MKTVRSTTRFGLSAIMIILATLPVPGHSQSKADTGSTTTTITGKTVYHAEGNINVQQQGATAQEISALINNKFDALRKTIDQRDLLNIKNDPFFRSFALNHYGKEIDQLDTATMAMFWNDLSQRLTEIKATEANYQRIRNKTGTELQALLPKIDKVREAFDYDEVDRLLNEFQEKHLELRHDLATVDYLQGQSCELQTSYIEAEQHYRKAAANDSSNPLYLTAHGTILQTLGRFPEAEPLYRQALAINEKKLGKAHPQVAVDNNNLGGILYAQGRYTEAESMFRQSLFIREKQLARNHPDLAASINNLAIVLKSLGKYNEAEPLYRLALAITTQQAGNNHSDTAISLNNLAELLRAQGRYEEAEPMYRQSLEIHEHALVKKDQEIATGQNNLAIMLHEQGKESEAWALFRQSLTTRIRKLGKDHPLVASSLNNLASLLNAQGRDDDAETLFRRALAIREQKLGKEHPDFATSLNNLAMVLGSQGKHDEAEPLYRQALAIYEQKFGKEHPTTRAARKNLALLLEKKNSR